MSAYSPYKIVHHQSHLEALRMGRQTNPLQLQIVPTNRCNHNCKLCAYRLEGYTSNQLFNHRDQLSDGVLMSVLKDASAMGIKAIQFTGGGEPLLHPKFKEAISFCQSSNMDYAVVTNGALIDEELAALIGQGAWARVSLDSATAATHKKVHQSNDFDKVIQGIKRLRQAKSSKFVLGVGFVVQEDNFEEVYEAAKLAKELGADNFRISAAFTPQGMDYFKGFWQRAAKLSILAEELSDDTFRVFNMFNDRLADLFHGTQNYSFCPIKDLLAYLGADGRLYTCCTLAYNEKGLIGNVGGSGLRELWASDEKKSKFAHHVPRQDCQHPCMYEKKNDFINYCIRHDPEHVAFI